MRIESAAWTPEGNVLIVHCECGKDLRHPSDHWRVRCLCGREENVEKLRREYAARHHRPPKGEPP